MVRGEGPSRLGWAAQPTCHGMAQGQGMAQGVAAASVVPGLSPGTQRAELMLQTCRFSPKAGPVSLTSLMPLLAREGVGARPGSSHFCLQASLRPRTQFSGLDGLDVVSPREMTQSGFLWEAQRTRLLRAPAHLSVPKALLWIVDQGT